MLASARVGAAPASPYAGTSTRTSTPWACSAAGRAAETSASPPVLLRGAHSAVTNRARREGKGITRARITHKSRLRCKGATHAAINGKAAHAAYELHDVRVIF